MREAPALMAIAGLVLLGTVVGLIGSAWAGTRGYFACRVVRFFEPCPPLEARGSDRPVSRAGRGLPLTVPDSASTPGSTVTESLWVESHPGANGRGQVYVPPKPVREFLEAPTPERAQAYLAWNQQRLQSIARAVEMLRIVGDAHQVPAPEHSSRPDAALSTDATGTPTSRSTPAGQRPAGRDEHLPRALAGLKDPERRPGGITVVYAFASWCPYSAQQTPIVASWARSRPDLAITGLLFDSPPSATAQLVTLPFPVQLGSRALREQLGVQSYPTILFFKDGVPIEALSGLTPAARLEAMTRELAM